MVGHIPKKTDWVHHRFDLCALGCVVRGQGSYAMGDRASVRIAPGSLFAVFPGPAFHYGPDDGTFWEEYHVGWFGRDVRPYLASGAFPKDGAVRRVTNLARMVDMFEQLLGAARRAGPGDWDRAIVMAELLLVELYYADEGRAPARENPRRLGAVLEAVRRDAWGGVDFEQLAKRHGISLSRLRHLFKRETGAPPAQYVARLRCQRAARLLSETDRGVKDIAAEVGIHDPYLFSRVFKRHMGLSPRHYRKRSAALAPAG
jgi:AraC family transcriptional regulator, arabinose operon regulatory protein